MTMERIKYIELAHGTHSLAIVAVALLSFVLVGCGISGDAELTRYINKIKSRPAKPIEPLPEFKPLPTYSFPESDVRRSPFKPKVREQSTAFEPNAKRPKQPLEAFPLDALKFVGLLKESSTVWALIKQPDGLVSRVKVGDYMGQNYGQIISIKDKALTLEEAIKVAGKWEKKKISVNLNTPD